MDLNIQGKIKIIILLVVSCMASCHGLDNKEHPSVISPDGHISVSFQQDAAGRIGLSVCRNDSVVLNVMNIGMEVRQDVALDSGFKIADVHYSSCDSVWSQPWGENKEIREHYNAMSVILHNDMAVMILEVKVFDDGLGFRYRYDMKECDTLTLMAELTRFSFAHDGECWSIPANFESYEFLYRHQPLSQTEDANTPITIHFDNGLYCSVHEANLRNFAEMTLRRVDSLTFQSWLSPDNTGSGSVCRMDSSFTSWRTIFFGDKAVDLINSSLLLNLNEAPAKDVALDGIRPMKYIGIWWGMHLGINSWTPDARHGATTANAIKYIDFAADNNIDAVLFEGWNQGWEQWGGSQVFNFTQAAPDMDIDSVIAYAHSKGVEVIIHHETGGNIPNYESQLDSALSWSGVRGIHAVKTGYAGGFPDRQLHHSQYGIVHYNKVMRDALQAGVMIDVHEPIKPTGLRRTYPNLMTGEGVRGMEWNAWSDGNPPSHQVTLPFTRMLAGPLDYTPGIFDITYRSLSQHPEAKKWNQKDARECCVHTTIAKQCALWVILYSPMVMAADLIENYENHPMFQFFRDYNPDCDWSRALDGIPGEYVTVVRRAGDSFFLGAATNEEDRTVNVKLDFLEPEMEYDVVVYGDSEDADYRTNPTAYSIRHAKVRKGQVLQLWLAPGGGSAVVISKTKSE